MTFVETLSGNEQQYEYIKIDPNTDVTWENLGDILCEYTAAMIANRKARNSAIKRSSLGYQGSY